MKKKTRNSRGKTRAMETHFYTMDFFFSFTRIFLWTFRKIPYYFFLCPVSISIIVNAKKSRNSIGKTRAMETHLYTMQFLFSCTRTFLWTWRTISYYFFLYTCSYFYNNECTYVNTQKYELSTISGCSTISGRRAIGALKGRVI